MAIAFDSSAETNVTTSGTSHSHNHTCTGSDLVLVGGICAFDSPYDVVTAVTYNGVSMSQVAKRFRASGRGTYLYELEAPSTGTNSFSATTSSSIRLGLDSASFTGCAQSGQATTNGNQETASSTLTSTLTVGTDQSILVSSYYVNRTQSASTNTTIPDGGSNNVFAYSTSPVGTGSQSLVTTQSDSTWAVGTYAVIEPAVAAASDIKSIAGIAQADIKSMAGLTLD